MRHDGAFIKRAVRALGMSQGDFAGKLRLSRNHVITLFKQTEWDSEYKKEAEKILGVKVGDFNANIGQNVITAVLNKNNLNSLGGSAHDSTEEIENKADYFKGQVDLLMRLLREKETNPAKTETRETGIPLEIRDLINENDRQKAEKFFGNDSKEASICISNKFGKIEYVSKEFTNQTGYTIADISGRSAGELLQRDDVNKAEKKKMRDAVMNRVYYEGEVMNYSKSGEQIKCRLIIAPIKIKGIEKLIALAVFSKVNVLAYN